MTESGSGSAAGSASRASGTLATKYGDAIFADPPVLTRARLDERLTEWDGIDQHFTKTFADFLGGMQRRRVLDDRTRRLVQLGQFAIARATEHLDDALRAAIEQGVDLREALEAILLCQVYAGSTALVPALDVFRRVCDELGVLSQLRDGQLELDGHDRDLEKERAGWRPEAADDPRREALMERYGWLGVSSGIHYRGRHHLDLLAHRDAIDPEWAGLWLRFTYERMYSRWILDDRTRILCTVGGTLAAGDLFQARDHIVEALKVGIPPREVMEIVFLIGPYFGSPRMAACLRLFEEIMRDQGRLAEIGIEPAP